MSSAAREVERCAARWLEKREREDWSEHDQTALESWQAESVAHRVAFVRMDTAWKRTERLVALRFETSEKEIVAKKRQWIAIGAAVAAVIALGGFIERGVLSGTHETIYSTPIGGHESAILADGTRIELNTDTVLRARIDAHKRRVWLDRGEAYFQVKHDPLHPFTVMASGHRITDLGTKFLVRRDAGTVEIALTEGRLRFESADATVQPHSAVLIPGDTAIATADSINVAKKSAQELSSELSWRQGLLVFRYTTLAAAAAEFNRYNRKKLVIADESAGRLTIVGTFPTNGLEAFTRVTKEVFGLHVENLRNEIVIAR